MISAQKLQLIFDLEIERLLAQAKSAPLDAADIVKLERLVSAYSKYRDQNFHDGDSSDQLSTEELLQQAKA